MEGIADRIRCRYTAMEAVLDQRTRRLWAAAEARALGHGGIARVVEATGLARNTVRAGLQKLDQGVGETVPAQRARRPGGGRKRLSDQDPDLLKVLEFHLEAVKRGAPASPLRWTALSERCLAAALGTRGHRVSDGRRAGGSVCCGIQTTSPPISRTHAYGLPN